MKLYIGSILVISLILLNWNAMYAVTCFSVFIPVFVLIVISSSFIQLKMNERLCFRDCYIIHDSLLSRVLVSRVFVIVYYIFLSLIMTLSTLYSVIDYSFLAWCYLLFHISLVVFIYKTNISILNKSIKNGYLFILSREMTVNVSSVVLFVVYAYFLLYGYEPDYLAVDINTTISNATNSIGSSCVNIDFILRLKVELDATFWWLTNQTSDHVSNSRLKLFIWIVFIIVNSLAVIGINRFVAQMVYLIDRILDNGIKFK